MSGYNPQATQSGHNAPAWNPSPVQQFPETEFEAMSYPPYYGPSQRFYDVPPVAPESPDKFSVTQKLVLVATGLAVALGAAVVLIMANAGGGGNVAPQPSSSHAADFNNPETLSLSIKDKYNSDYQDPQSNRYNPSLHISSVTCLKQSQYVFECLFTYSNSSQFAVKATVAADGQTWITSGN